MNDPDLLHRRSIRLHDFDYAQHGVYFVTISSACVLGEIVTGAVRLSPFGEIVEKEWLRTPKIRPQVELDAYVIMPNHIHIIFFIIEPDSTVSVGAYCNTPLPKPAIPSKFRSPSQTVGAIVRGFKSATTKQINILRESPGLPFWQRNYYEHVIRHDRWAKDPNNPANRSKHP